MANTSLGEYAKLILPVSLLIFGVPVNTVAQEAKSLTQLQREVEAAERNFFDAFNDVTEEKDFKVKCESVKTVGSRRKEQVCSPRFIRRDQANRSAEFVTQSRWDSPSPAGSRMAKRKDELRAEISRLVGADENLQRAFGEFAAARRAHVEALQKK